MKGGKEITYQFNKYFANGTSFESPESWRMIKMKVRDENFFGSLYFRCGCICN